MKKYEQVCESIGASVETLTEQIGRMAKPEKGDNIPGAINDLHRKITKAQSTSGVTMKAGEMSKALDKLAEVEGWIEAKSKKNAGDRLAECLMWVKAGLGE